MPYYESVFIARQEISAQQAEALAENFAGVISEGGGNVTRTESWGLKSLAYRIKKNRKAHYTMLNIDGPAEAVHEMERQMRLHEDVLRYMTIRVDELNDEPSIQAQTRSSRDDRDDDDQGFKAREKSDESSSSAESSDDTEEKEEAADEADADEAKETEE
ncbi:MAG: 30S ribosomal protein S6 [Rhodospirillaceae bacterium]|jgi:small subunit ribosomal protein S6